MSPASIMRRAEPNTLALDAHAQDNRHGGAGASSVRPGDDIVATENELWSNRTRSSAQRAA